MDLLQARKTTDESLDEVTNVLTDYETTGM